MAGVRVGGESGVVSKALDDGGVWTVPACIWISMEEGVMKMTFKRPIE